MAEPRTLFERSGVFVSERNILIHGTTFSIPKVSSVSVTKIPAKKGCATTILLISAWVALMAILHLTSSEVLDNLLLFVMAAAIAVLAGLWILKKKPSYLLRLGQGVGEVHALKTRDRDFVYAIEQAVKQALQASSSE